MLKTLSFSQLNDFFSWDLFIQLRRYKIRIISMLLRTFTLNKECFLFYPFTDDISRRKIVFISCTIYEFKDDTEIKFFPVFIQISLNKIINVSNTLSKSWIKFVFNHYARAKVGWKFTYAWIDSQFMTICYQVACRVESTFSSFHSSTSWYHFDAQESSHIFYKEIGHLSRQCWWFRCWML